MELEDVKNNLEEIVLKQIEVAQDRGEDRSKISYVLINKKNYLPLDVHILEFIKSMGHSVDVIRGGNKDESRTFEIKLGK